jgi:hypothetical protein
VRDHFVQLLLSRLSLDSTYGSTSCSEFIQLLCRLLYDAVTLMPEAARLSKFASLFDSLVRRLFVMPITESGADTGSDDDLLIGVLNLLSTLVSIVPALRSEEHLVLDGRHLIAFLFDECLFVRPTAAVPTSKHGNTPPKCKRGASRTAAFALLSALCKDNARNLRQVVETGLCPLQDCVTKVRVVAPPAAVVPAAATGYCAGVAFLPVCVGVAARFVDVLS